MTKKTLSPRSSSTAASCSTLKSRPGRAGSTGDGILAEFASVLEAVRCAVAIQRSMAERNAAIAAERRIVWRIGINLGDVIAEDNDIYGDGVNIAARLESLAPPGEIMVASAVFEQVRDRLPGIVFEDAGERALKNIARAIRAYRVRFAESPLPGCLAARPGRLRAARGR